MKITFPSTPIQTNRLSLRPFMASDFDQYAAYHSQPSVYRYLYTAPPAANALTEQFSIVLTAPFDAEGDVFRLAVINRDDDTLLGEVLLKLASIAALQAEVGYIFNPDFSGHGYATEAVSAMIDLGFNHFGFHRIFARLDTENIGSVGIVERLGLRCEAHLIENDRFNGVWGDEYIYAVLAAEWQSRSRNRA
ncbi:GNAT family N-acetyltransferase [Thalassospira xiamenensis]|jgi:RimJ/RimL family protein N-acetyltransferase|uniref:Acetyltransferase n=1 Tax=Thalassospira xiamenensis TaxID=220697 RepID=A0A367XEZ8_9PROT|nr:GNAT family protein [Thalassospira xiamenensis]KZB52372.1 acetyltransferase [Thalassospira xiamenensis]MCK2168408.1 GNAT family N-acetyltransferase [Thalassospira xiamenensis]RCK51351.1 acetyltransferase [Thalassospira xiamenensis]